MDEVYQNLPVYARLISEAETIEFMKAIFYTLCVIDGIIVFAFLCMFHRIGIAIGLIKEASKAMLKIPSMLLVPVFITMAIIPFAVYFIYIGAYLGTAGTPTYNENGAFQGYVSDKVLLYMMLYHLFGGYWTLNFLHALGECIIAGAIGSWYWVQDKHVCSMLCAPE
jgi:choline transporter-like protein 2/4/5